jgi:hypothetical protein
MAVAVINKLRDRVSRIDFRRLQNTYGYIMVGGFVLYVLGFIWLYICSKRLEKSYNKNTSNMANQVTYAVILCLAGLIAITIGGCILVTM